jgi:hypothetical protein
MFREMSKELINVIAIYTFGIAFVAGLLYVLQV